MTPASSRPAPEGRDRYPRFVSLATRWLDNDAYGHVNNAVYYTWFDTAVNRHLIEAGALDVAGGAVIGLVVETCCNYHAPLSFPQTVEIGLRVAHIGASSVRYELGVFAAGETLSAARGHFVHVYVDRATRRPTALPAPLLRAVQELR